jgi:hypothetical protein
MIISAKFGWDWLSSFRGEDFFLNFHVSYCHHFSSVVRPSTFHMLIFSSETTGPIATKLWWNGPWVACLEICVRWSRLPTKMATKQLKFELILTYTNVLKQQWTIEEISIFSNSSHLEWRTGLSDTSFKGHHPRTTTAKFGLICINILLLKIDFFLFVHCCFIIHENKLNF